MTEVKTESQLVKICGLREVEHALAAADAGADLLGFVFATSRRQVTPEEAARIVAAVQNRHGGNVRMVGVFVAPSEVKLERTIDIASLDFAQIHGRIAPVPQSRCMATIIPTIAPAPGADIDEVAGEIRLGSNLHKAPWTHLDAYDPVQHGGTGKRADWEVAAKLSAAYPLMLAGGLTPGNVGDAIRTVRPLGVDVSSGVERDGTKDIGLIEGFVARAREAFAEERD